MQAYHTGQQRVLSNSYRVPKMHRSSVTVEVQRSKHT